VSKKLKDNGLWESSRMMLPEHKQEIINHREELQKRKKPLMDEQELELIFQSIGRSLRTGKEISIVVFGEIENTVVTGKVTKADSLNNRIQISGELVNVSDIINIVK
jgi:hypothetical protein